MFDTEDRNVSLRISFAGRQLIAKVDSTVMFDIQTHRNISNRPINSRIRIHRQSSSSPVELRERIKLVVFFFFIVWITYKWCSNESKRFSLENVRLVLCKSKQDYDRIHWQEIRLDWVHVYHWYRQMSSMQVTQYLCTREFYREDFLRWERIQLWSDLRFVLFDLKIFLSFEYRTHQLEFRLRFL